MAAINLDAADWERQLIDGVADFAVRDRRPGNPKLRCITLAEESYVVVMRPNHPLSRGLLDPERYCRAEHALVSVSGGGFYGAVDTQLAASGRTRNVMVSVPTFLAGVDLVRRSDFLLSLPRRLAQHFQGLVVSRPLPVPSPSFEVALVWHARTEGSRPHAWFRAVIGKVGIAADLLRPRKNK